MKKDSTLQVRMDAELKAQVEDLYHSLGTTFAEAVRVFARQSLLKGGLPFVMVVPPVARKTAFGYLAEYGNPALAKQEKDAYIMALKERHHGAD